MTPNERVLEVREALKLKPSEFARTLGMAPGNLHNITSGKRPVSTKLLSRLSEAYGIDPVWVMDGKGRMQKPALLPEVVVPVVVDRKNNTVIKLVPFTASAGYLTSREDHEYWDKLNEISLPADRYRHGQYLGFQVSGDSMEPTIQNGDFVIGRRLDRIASVSPRNVYVVVTLDDLLVKRVEVDTASGCLLLLSDNDYYPAQRVALEDVRELWKFDCLFRFSLDAPPRR